MTRPYLSIDLDKIEHNARTIVRLCQTHGIQVFGVTKCVCGHPEVARAMLRGGVSSLADSRLENIHRLKTAGFQGVWGSFSSGRRLVPSRCPGRGRPAKSQSDG